MVQQRKQPPRLLSVVEVINLEQTMAQNGLLRHRNHRRHQLVDKFTGGGEAIHTDSDFWFVDRK